jgi:DNA polymerase-3 subunit gamma/tau
VEQALSAATGSNVTIDFVVAARSHDDTDVHATKPTPPVADPAPRSTPTTESRTTPEPSTAASRAPEPADMSSTGDSRYARGSGSSAGSGSDSGSDSTSDDDIDLDDLTDAPPDSVKTPIDRLAEAFPGSELVDEA